jgi:UDP-N-acetylglucosamine:LPS N-acetylglucosamine transferase
MSDENFGMHVADVPAVRVLAVASAGGHWVQLQRLSPAFAGARLTWLSTQDDLARDLGAPFYVVTDANLWQKLALVRMFAEVLWVLLRVRPDVVVTTGAAPGFAALVWGRLLGAHTIWIDSIANSETLSTSGAKVGRFAHVWLTQWEHLAHPGGPEYWGAVL